MIAVMNGQQPRYLEVRNALLEQMRSGAIHDGEKIPTEAELCEIFDTSRITIRRAVQELVQEGALERRHGVGTFARVSGFAPSLMSLGGFSAATALHSQAQRRIITAELVNLGHVESAQLALPAGAPAVHLYRVLLDGDMPLGLDETYYSSDRMPGFLDEVDNSTSTFPYMEHRYGLIPSASQGTLRIGYVSAQEAGLLELPVNEAVIRINKIVKDQYDRPLVYSKLVVHPVRTSMSFDVHRAAAS